MKFTEPAGHNPTDHLTVVGHALTRVDGPLKVSGHAAYSYERNDDAPDAAYGYILGSGIAKGRIVALDTAAAQAAPGVIAMVTGDDYAPGDGKPFHGCCQSNANRSPHDAGVALRAAA